MIKKKGKSIKLTDTRMDHINSSKLQPVPYPLHNTHELNVCSKPGYSEHSHEVWLFFLFCFFSFFLFCSLLELSRREWELACLQWAADFCISGACRPPPPLEIYRRSNFGVTCCYGEGCVWRKKRGWGEF